MLDIVQSFTLLSYCIVSPIYISLICNVEIHYYEKIKLGILYFSLFTNHIENSPFQWVSESSNPKLYDWMVLLF